MSSGWCWEDSNSWGRKQLGLPGLPLYLRVTFPCGLSIRVIHWCLADSHTLCDLGRLSHSFCGAAWLNWVLCSGSHRAALWRWLGCIPIWRLNWGKTRLQAPSGIWRNSFPWAIRLKGLASSWLSAGGHPELLPRIRGKEHRSHMWIEGVSVTLWEKHVGMGICWHGHLQNLESATVCPLATTIHRPPMCKIHLFPLPQSLICLPSYGTSECCHTLRVKWKKIINTVWEKTFQKGDFTSEVNFEMGVGFAM